MKPRIIITSILMLFMSSSITWGQEPINIDTLFKDKFSDKLINVHGQIIDLTPPPNVQMVPTYGSHMDFGSGMTIIAGENKKLIQKIFIECNGKICSVSGKILPTPNVYEINHYLILDSYTVGISADSIEVGEFNNVNLFGTSLYYEGPISWGTDINISEVPGEFGVGKYYLNFSGMSQDQQLSLLDHFQACKKVKVSGKYIFYGILVDQFKCLD